MVLAGDRWRRNPRSVDRDRPDRDCLSEFLFCAAGQLSRSLRTELKKRPLAPLFSFFEIKNKSLNFSKADIFDSEFLKQYRGKFKGAPFRTYVGLKYKGGYSDHFPVYVYLKQN